MGLAETLLDGWLIEVGTMSRYREPSASYCMAGVIRPTSARVKLVRRLPAGRFLSLVDKLLSLVVIAPQ
jgi:hypothetical protein